MNNHQEPINDYMEMVRKELVKDEPLHYNSTQHNLTRLSAKPKASCPNSKRSRLPVLVTVRQLGSVMNVTSNMKTVMWYMTISVTFTTTLTKMQASL